MRLFILMHICMKASYTKNIIVVGPNYTVDTEIQNYKINLRIMQVYLKFRTWNPLKIIF